MTSGFLVLKTARYLDDVEEVEFGEIQVFIGDGFLVHVRHGEASPLHLVRKDAENHPNVGWGEPRCSTPSPTTSSTRMSR